MVLEAGFLFDFLRYTVFWQGIGEVIRGVKLKYFVAKMIAQP
jgi:hypothetical protein